MKKAASILILLLYLQASFGQTATTAISTQTANRVSVDLLTAPLHMVDTIIRTDFRENVTIYYRFDNADIDATYLTNAEALDFMDDKLFDAEAFSHLDSLSLQARSSPEGPLAYNKALSQRRAESLRSYLIERYPHSEQKLKIGYSGEDWDGLRDMVIQSSEIPNKDDVLAIIDSDINLDIKEFRLKTLDEGRSWEYISDNIMKYLRYGASAIFYYDLEYSKSIIAEPQHEPEPIVESVAVEELEVDSEEVEELEPKAIEPTFVRKPLFALKTNLLYDAATVLNVSAEVPIGKRVSLAAEWICPWWRWDNGQIDSKRHRLQLLYGNVEARVWFGSRERIPILTGWYAGLYSGGGKYDFEYDKAGVQGEFFVAAGLSAGYAHTINKAHTLRMEYSASVGYVETHYRDYNSIYGEGVDDKWHPIRKSTGEYTYIGPTALKVSLVWMLHNNTKVKGDRK